jgi:transcriptional regulator with XRE-family HTH domain
MSKIEDDINERLIEFCRYKGITESELGRQLGVSRQSVNGWFKKRRDISLKYVAVIQRLYQDLNVRWLAYGEGSMIIDPASRSIGREKENEELRIEISILKKEIEKSEEIKKDLYKQIGRLEYILEQEKKANKPIVPKMRQESRLFQE